MESKPFNYTTCTFIEKYPLIYVGLFVTYYILLLFASKILLIYFISNDVILNPQNLWTLTNTSLSCGLLTYFITWLILSRFHLLSSVENIFLTSISAAGLVYVLTIPIQFMIWMNPLTLHQGETYDVAMFQFGKDYHIRDGKTYPLPKSQDVLGYSLYISKPDQRIGQDGTFHNAIGHLALYNRLLETHNHLALKVEIDSIHISVHGLESNQSIPNEMDDLELLNSLHPNKNLDKRFFFYPDFKTSEKTVVLLPNEIVELDFVIPENQEKLFEKTFADFLRMRVELIPTPTNEPLMKGTIIPIPNEPTRRLRKLDT